MKIFLLSALSCLRLNSVLGTSIACDEFTNCEAILRKGSRCVDGMCSNPFHHQGCLKSYLDDDDPRWNGLPRVCGSDDPPEAELRGDCRPSPFDYAEVRLQGMDWESANYLSWIHQILLSEVLQVS